MSHVAGTVHRETTTYTPVQLAGTRAEDIAELRKKLHAVVDSMIDQIEYDVHGEAVNRVNVTVSKDFISVPVMADTDVHVSGDRKLEFSVSTTYRRVTEEIERLRAVNVAAEAERISKGYTMSMPVAEDTKVRKSEEP